jgi:hypothetical protein
MLLNDPAKRSQHLRITCNKPRLACNDARFIGSERDIIHNLSFAARTWAKAAVFSGYWQGEDDELI